MDMDEATTIKQEKSSEWRSRRAEGNKEIKKTCPEYLGNGATTERYDPILVFVNISF